MSYEYPAWCQMETALDSYEQDRAAYLKREAHRLGHEGQARLDRFTKVADSLVKGVQELAGMECDTAFAELIESKRFLRGKPFELLAEHVCITFGWEALEMLGTAQERFFDLFSLLQDRRPCGFARAFLQRVARCYLFGFDAECVVMCRSVLDREFGEVIVDDDQVSDWWRWYATTAEAKYRGRRPPYGQLWAKIHAACHAGMISEADRDAADAVRIRGNEAVHRRPDSGNAIEVVRHTVQVLDALEKNRR